MATAKPEKLNACARAGLLAPYDSWGNRVAIDRFVKDIPASPRHATWNTLERLEQELSDLIDWPVQLIWGMKDWCFRPACLWRLAELFPNADIVQLEHASHYVVEDEHERVLEHLRAFLAKVYDSCDGHPRSSPLPS